MNFINKKAFLLLLISATTMTLFCQIETVGETNYDEQPYTIDTFFVLKYGKEIGMLATPASNPFFFRVTENNTYVFQNKYKGDDTALVIDRNGKFIEKKKVPTEAEDLIDVYSWEDGLVLLDFFKMYYVDWNMNIVNSINYTNDKFLSPLFGFEGIIFFKKPYSKDTILKYDIKNRLYSDIAVHSVWGIESKKCCVNPFSLDSLWGGSYFIGASKKIVVINSTNIENESKKLTIFNVSKGVVNVLVNFKYFINPTLSPGSTLQFIDDTTAIFFVRYWDERDTCLDQRDCEEYNSSPSSDPNGVIRSVPRNCVFYRIKFLMN